MLDGVRSNPRFRKISPHVIGTPSILKVRPGISQSELARYLGCTRATAGKQVVVCVRHGWVRRTRSLDDRRTYLLELTAAGSRMLDSVADIVAEHEEWMVASLPRADRAMLRTLLRRFILG
jgi:DNA-binding MarR family transcriptional regulator